MARARTVVSRDTVVDAVKDAEAVETEVQVAATEAVEQVTEAAAEVASEAVAQTETRIQETTATIEASRVTFNEGITKTMKSAEEVVAFGQGNVEAFIKSGQIWAAGVQDLSKQMAASAQASYEESLAAFKALTSVKSLKEAIDLQVGFARSALEKGMTESSKYTDASFKLAEQAIAPISSRMTMAVEKLTKTV